jgi:4-amino-4-deoxy-L-arabinose transferase-like glycosyltransferase
MAWLTALSLSPETVTRCSNPDPAVREPAFRDLASEARYPSLFMGVFLIYAVHALGVMVGGRELGRASAVIAAGSFALLRFSQVAITDVPLTLFVTFAHAFFALAVFQRRPWVGLIGAGVCVGLAFMSKGPAALMMTALPWSVWAIWRHARRQDDHKAAVVPPVRWRGPMVGSVAAFLAIALPWYLAMLVRDPNRQWHLWWLELSGEDAATDRGEPLFTYLWIIWELMFPWVLFFAGGLYLVAVEWKRRRNLMPSSSPDRWQRFVLLLIAILVPLILFTLRKEKKDRYLLPILGPCAVLAARCALVYFSERPRSAARDWVGWVHWIILAVASLGLPILGLTGLPQRFNGLPAYSPRYASIVIATATVLLLAGLFTHLTRRRGMLVISALLMFLTAHVFTVGYRDTAPGQSEMKPLADALWKSYPDAQLLTTQPFGIRASTDLSIYMNRTTGWTTPPNMTEMTPADRPIVVIMRQRAKEPIPTPGEQWRLFMTLPKGDGSFWHAFVLPSK